MNINKNKGMYLESIINNSIEHYEKNKIALFRKLSIPVKIIEINDNNKIIGKIFKKSDVDYYGIYKGKFIAIEAKQTIEPIFYLHNIQEHQINFLNDINEIYSGFSMLIIYFKNYNIFYCLPWNNIKNLTKIEVNNNEFEKYKLDLLFPGRLNFVEKVLKKCT
ncbi:MAG: Holliday junction resolvase RecU [Candidatus Ureaplasma intestinipullorum]|uniref:Holliday junction resolvase RecU n=1 Tax=Candidatus Ureaplasma intestinipullorum TaxID=2838770 RepID=A0A9E2KVR5_9BACT|nr:Holliday junction resolvase RecU [Candidatus Ureaplasma intestinipullorum]